MQKLKLLVIFSIFVFVVASAAQLRQIGVVDIPGRPGFESIVWAEGKLVMSHPGADRVDVFDPVKRRIVTQIEGMKDPRGIAVDGAASKVYIATAGANAIAVVDAKTWQLTNTISLSAQPSALLLVPGGLLYVTNLHGTSVLIVDPVKGGEVARVDMGGTPEQLAWDPQQHGVFVSMQDRATVALIGSDNQVSKRYQLTAWQPTGLALDARQRRLFVAVRYAVLVVNADTGAEIARIPAAAGTDSLWFDESNGTLYAADSGGVVNMIRTDNNQFISEHELRTEVRGHTIAFDPEKKMVYLPGGSEGRSKLVILRRVEAPAGAPATSAKQAVVPQPTVAEKH